MMLALQISAAVVSLLGAWLLRKPGAVAPWGFVAWIVSNPIAMTFMALNGHWWFVVMHAAFLLLAIEAVWNWMVAPALAGVTGEPS